MSSPMMKKWLVMIISSVLAAVSADGSSFPLSGSLNAEKYETVGMKNRLLLKHNTSRREVSPTFDKEGGEDKRQYEMEESFNNDNGDAFSRKDGVWIFHSTVPGGSRFDNQPHIDYAVVGETFIVRSWSLNDASLSITIKQGDLVRLSASFNAGTYEIAEDKKSRLVLKHNITGKEVSLIFDKVGNEDEGQYEMKENYNKSNGETHTKKDDTWIFRLKVLKPDEIKRGNVGENVTILRLNKSNSSFPLLYHNDQFVTVLKDTDCDLNSTSHLYGRLRCERDKAENRYRIELQNVEQKDTGLYRVNADGYDTERCFLNITDLTVTSNSSSVTSNTVEESFPHAMSSVSVIGTTVASRLHTITIQDGTEAFYYSQLSTESLSATAKSSSPENTSNPVSVPVYIIPIIVGSVGGIILMICCRRRIKRNMTYSVEGGTISLRL